MNLILVRIGRKIASGFQLTLLSFSKTSHRKELVQVVKCRSVLRLTTLVSFVPKGKEAGF
jgi:hypothetical protein